MSHAQAEPPAPKSPQRRRIRGLDAEQRRAERRERLLDSALELFAGQGYPNTSIEQLCQHAYVGTKGFYEIFESREDCYLALLRRTTEHLKTRMTERLATVTGDREDAEHALLSALAHALIDDPRIAAVTFGQGVAVSPAVERQRRENRRWAASFVEALWRSQGLAPAPPAARSAAIGLIGGLFDLIADWLLDADPADPAATDALITALTAFYAAVRTGVAARP
ncbi:TetR/AcrR family transcriptional regulator [Actinomadura flavalba]|uniref:TetR/AcrR family transcriptional regulator n=1 Tax=Actinomadura flavalba TaxID=1120938 RepID=UPI00037CD90B|nr:TetR/AcrR family transcriptional regulator [Actinomadura flavalba]